MLPKPSEQTRAIQIQLLVKWGDALESLGEWEKARQCDDIVRALYDFGRRSFKFYPSGFA